MQMDEERKREKRQQEQDAIQKLLTQAQIANQNTDNERAARGEQRLEANDLREQVRSLLEGLPEATQVDPETAARIRQAGYGNFVEDRLPSRNIPMSVEPVGSPQMGPPSTLPMPVVESAGGTFAKPYETAQTRMAREQLGRLVEQDAEQRRQFNVTNDRLTHQGNELDSYRSEIAGLRAQAIEAQLARATDASANNVVARKADLLQTLVRLGTAMGEPTLGDQDRAALQAVADQVRAEIAKLDAPKVAVHAPKAGSPEAAASVQSHKNALVPDYVRSGTTPPVDAKVAAFGAAVRGRK
jgi:hypothetical protein